MKKLILRTVLVVVFLAISSNYILAQKLTHIGAKLGLNMTTLRMDVDEAMELNLRSGFAIGGFLTYSLSETFALQPELIYTQKGVDSEAEEQGLNVKVSFKFNYLEIPILAKLTLPTQGNIKPSLFFGPTFAFKLSSKFRMEALGVTVEEDLDDVKSTDFGFVFGGGLDYDYGPGKFIFDARYTLGLSNIDDIETDETIKNGVFSILAGYSLNTDFVNVGNYSKSTRVSKKGSMGAGFGIPYGVFGVNGEYAVAKNINISAGVGTTVFAGAGFNLGLKYYLKDDSQTWRPRVSAYYGTNGVINVQYIGYGSDIKESYTGLTLGIGQKWMWGASKRHGLDLDVLYIVTSGVFDRVDRLQVSGLDVAAPIRFKVSIGYRYGF